MSARRGPLLERLVSRLTHAANALDEESILGRSGVESDAAVPVFFQLDPGASPTGEGWLEYSERTMEQLSDVAERLGEVAIGPVELLRAARAFSMRLPIDRLEAVEAIAGGRMLELDAPAEALALDEAGPDIGLSLAVAQNPQLDGRGVRVAVLDNGIDAAHPALQVAEAHTTCGEGAGVGGVHGTAVAGCLASSDLIYRGVAPAVEIIDIKVAASISVTALPAHVLAGIDLALDRHAHVLSMSLGFNQLPVWWDGGHGWSCPDGRCPLCVAADRAALVGAVVVAGAGNDHRIAEGLRYHHPSEPIPTEMRCPAQARSVAAIAALHKRTFDLWNGSSWGPASYSERAPTLAAPGVNVTTTAPVPRTPQGTPTANPSRAQLFARRTGTSIATPFVAGAAALTVQKFMEQGIPWRPSDVVARLTSALAVPGGNPLATGAGRLELLRI